MLVLVSNISIFYLFFSKTFINFGKGKNVRNLIQQGLIIRKNIQNHSNDRKRLFKEAKKKGRHRGDGKKKGTSNARSSKSCKWLFRQRVFRNILKKYRKAKKITTHLYKELYYKCKGNVFKSKRIMLDYIYNVKKSFFSKKHDNDIQMARKKKKAQEIKNRMQKIKSAMESIFLKKN